MENRLQRRLKDMDHEFDINALFDDGDRVQILNRLILIEQQMNRLVEMAAMFLQNQGQQVIR